MNNTTGRMGEQRESIQDTLKPPETFEETHEEETEDLALNQVHTAKTAFGTVTIAAAWRGPEGDETAIITKTRSCKNKNRDRKT